MLLYKIFEVIPSGLRLFSLSGSLSDLEEIPAFFDAVSAAVWLRNIQARYGSLCAVFVVLPVIDLD